MKRRDFLKFLGFAVVAPSVGAEILSNVPSEEVLTLDMIRNATAHGGSA